MCNGAVPLFLQAAIGALALDKARYFGNKEGIVLGKQILTLAVLSIIITAPIGAAIIALSGPRLLHQTVKEDGEPNNKEEVEDEEKG